MPASLADYYKGRQLLTGRICFALSSIHKVASDECEPGLRPRIERALEQAKKTLTLERNWEVTKNTRTKGRGDAAQIDVEFDAAWKALEQSVRGQLFGPTSEPSHAAALKLVEQVFPLGISAITQLPFEMQLSQSDSLLDALDDKLAEYVKTLHLERHVKTLRDVANRFRTELEKHPKSLTWDEVSAEQNRTQELYTGVLFKILGQYSDSEDVSEVTRREELMAEPNRQDEAMLDFYRRRRKALDVHPETGEVIETEAAELAAPPPNPS